MNKELNGNGQKLYPLRIDARTVIYVPREKCNENYAQLKRAKFSRGGGKVSLANLAF